jgi:hypothetical protein
MLPRSKTATLASLPMMQVKERWRGRYEAMAEPVERQLLSVPASRAVENILTGLCNRSVTAWLGVHERLRRATYPSMWRLIRHT